MTPMAMKFSMIVEITSLTPRLTFRMPGIQAQNAPTTMAVRMISADVEGGRQVDRGPHRGGDERGQPVLAVDADVEQVHLEPDGHGQAGQDTGGWPGSRWRSASWPGCRSRTWPVRLDRALPDEGQGDRGHGEREQQGGHRGERLSSDPAQLHADAPPGSPRRSCTSRAPAGSRSGDRPWPRDGRRRSRTACRTGRSAPRGRPRSAGRRGPRGGPRGSSSHTAAWAPTSMPRVGWPAMSTCGSADHLPADDQLLLVARRTARRRRRRDRGPPPGTSRMIA